MKGKAQDNVFLVDSFDGAIKHAPDHPDCPYYTTQEVMEQRHYFDYTPQIQRIINVVATKKLDPVGSSRYVVHKYPSDIDLLEPIIECCSINKVRMNIAKKIQALVVRVQNEPNMFFSRFQAGYDRRYDVYLGMESEGMVVDYSSLIARRTIRNLFDQNLLAQEERRYALELAVEQPTVDQFVSLYWFLRDKMIIEWTPAQIAAGQKQLVGNKTIYLDEALIDRSLVKLDVLAQIDYSDMKGKRYVEVTNWFLVEVKNQKGELEVLSMVQEDRVKSLRADIFLYRKKDPLKAAKRYWNYLFEVKRTTRVEQELTKLAPLFSSYPAFLNSIVTDLTIQQRMLRRGMITKAYYEKFLVDTRRRMLTVAPACFISRKNRELAESLDINEMTAEIARLVNLYLKVKKIDILGFVEKN